ncbi:glycerophosphodiester phosphodiesterase family protein [Alistipes provencensis]|uniref:glycerophosphodiester phosphodiesterase family protein n=1 Tax=Alistipes provencensis TaxID=1816676 RepID=UPI0007EC90C8|nr:glycerophosphodiester phosphodiesterase family protein [Alistipes provencensis]
MKRLLILLLACFSLLDGTTQTRNAAADRASAIVAEIHSPASKKVLVASHRGDWRNYPENSLPAIRSAIEMGVDIVEIDLALTSDSVLVLCHDRTIDRTTSGKGLIAEITYDSIRRVNLRAGQNAVTHWKVPTLEEALILCKDKIVVNIDKGFQYYGLIHPLLEKYGMLEQVLIKSNVTADRAAATFSKYVDNCLFMPIVNFGKKSYRKILESYERLKYPLLAYEICWSEYTPEVETCMREVIAGGSKLWVNSLWPSLNGGLCDDAAIEGDPAEVYGKLVDMGATLIQTDRPELLISYLRSRGLHD